MRPPDKTYLLQLAQLVPSISNVETYANIVRDKYDTRTLIVTAREILEEAGSGRRCRPPPCSIRRSSGFLIFGAGRICRGFSGIDEMIVRDF